MLKKILNIIRAWKLPVAMIIGVLLYFLFNAVIPDETERISFYQVISHYFQPTLIFTMLLLSFLKVDPRDLKPHRWHGMLLLVQGSLFVCFSLLALVVTEYEPQLIESLTTTTQHLTPNTQHLTPTTQHLTPTTQHLTPITQHLTPTTLKLMLEGAMLCFICPTATASAVIVQKLGGSLSGDVTYIVLCNLMVSLLAPGFLTLVEPHLGLDFFTEFFMIMGKVFPLLLCPLFVALVIRHYTPKLKEKLLAIPDLAFYMWLVALALAITVTVRTIIESSTAISVLLGFAVVSAICCVVQFWLGRKIGRHWPQPTKHPSEWKSKTYDPATYVDMEERSAITAGQAFGQKNTVFVIWMGLVFLNPITSVVGGFYSIWHNIINSWQLYKMKNVE